MLKLNEIYCADCLDKMNEIDSETISLILTDLPYETTECEWDCLINSDILFNQFRRILKDKGTIVMTVCFPFGIDLIYKNKDLFKYDLIWAKTKTTNFANAKNKPMRKHENILVFSKGTTANGSDRRMTYNPQGLIEINKEMVNSRNKKSNIGIRENYNDNKYVQQFTNYPNTILNFNSVSKTVHPTQKPIELFEWLIKSYSNEGELVFDPCAGSGTTCLAAKNTHRNFIGFEMNPEYIEIIHDRLNNVGNICK